MGIVPYPEHDESVAPAVETDPLQENDPWQNQQPPQQQQPQLQPQTAIELEMVPTVLDIVDQPVMPTAMPMPPTTEVSVESGINSDGSWSLYGNSVSTVPTPGITTVASSVPLVPTWPPTTSMSPITEAVLPYTPVPQVPRPPTPAGQDESWPTFPYLTSGFVQQPQQQPPTQQPLQQHGIPRSSIMDVLHSVG